MDLRQIRESMRVGPALVGAIVVLAIVLGCFALTTRLNDHSPTPTTGDQLPPGLTTDSSGNLVPTSGTTSTTIDPLATLPTTTVPTGTTAPFGTAPG